MTYGRDCGEKSRERLREVRRTKSGKYGSVIKDPIKKKQVWLGSFNNAEEATSAYLSKMREFEEQVQSRQAVKLQPTVCRDSGCTNMIHKEYSGEKSGERIRGFRRTKSEKYCSVINDPIKKKQVRLGSFDSAKEVANAHLSNRPEFEEQLKARLAPQLKPIVSEEPGLRNMKCKRDSGEKSGERLRGVRRTTSGKYGSVIKVPIKKKPVWLGSFNNAEEAANAYLSKKRKFEEQLKARPVVQLQPTVHQDSGCTNMIQKEDSGEESGERFRGVRRTKSEKYGSVINDLIKKKQVRLGSFYNAKEVANAYLSKRHELEEQLKDRLAVQLKPTESEEPGLKNMKCRRDSGEKSGERLRGVRITTSGKYGSVIKDPIKKKPVWLGSFNNAEETANAHLSKTREFEEQIKATQVVQIQPTLHQDSGCTNMIHKEDSGEKSGEILRGSGRTKSEKYGSVNDLIKKTQAQLGSFYSAKEVANAYLSKRNEFEEQHKARLAGQLKPTVSEEPGLRNMKCRRDFSEKSGERLRVVRRTTSGKYGSVIKDPIKKKPVWLGSFNKAEEAANAYISKRREFEEELKARQAVQLQPTMYQNSGCTNMILLGDSSENSGEKLRGVRPIKKKHVRLGSFYKAEQVANVYLSKRHGVKEKLKAKQAVQLKPTFSEEPGHGTMKCGRDSGEKSGERLRGVRRTTSGRYGSVISDPIKKKKVWLGSFDNAEEAANAYLSKRREFEEQLKAKQPVLLQPNACEESGCINMQRTRGTGEKSGERLIGVRRRKSGKYSSEIQDPIMKKKIWLGTFRTAEAAANAYLSKKSEFQEKLKARQVVQRQPILGPSSMSETEALALRSLLVHHGYGSETCDANAFEIVKVENTEGCIMGLFKPFPSCQGGNVGSEFFLPILDNNGFLLGEFSKLDDLSICLNEDDYVPTEF